MSQSKTIRISEETLEKLGNLRQGFETPDNCICRILSLYSEKVPAKFIPNRIIYTNGKIQNLD